MPNKCNTRKENWISIIITLLFIIGFLILSNISNIPTSYVIQNRFMINNISISIRDLDQEIKIEQFDDYPIKFDDALYYFTAKDKLDYITIEFMVDNSQLSGLTKEEISLYLYDYDSWRKLETKFIKQIGRYYYYNSKTQTLGLFAIAPIKKEIKKQDNFIIKESLTKKEIILFGLLPLIIIFILLMLIIYKLIKYLFKKTRKKLFILL